MMVQALIGWKTRTGTLTSAHILGKLEEHDWRAELVLHLLKTQRKTSRLCVDRLRRTSVVTGRQLYVMPTLEKHSEGFDASVARRSSNSVSMTCGPCSPKELGHCLKWYNTVCTSLTNTRGYI